MRRIFKKDAVGTLCCECTDELLRARNSRHAGVFVSASSLGKILWTKGGGAADVAPDPDIESGPELASSDRETTLCSSCRDVGAGSAARDRPVLEQVVVVPEPSPGDPGDPGGERGPYPRGYMSARNGCAMTVPPSYFLFPPAATAAAAADAAARGETSVPRNKFGQSPPGEFRSDSEILRPSDFFLDIPKPQRRRDRSQRTDGSADRWSVPVPDPCPDPGPRRNPSSDDSFLDSVVTMDPIPIKSATQKILASVANALGTTFAAWPGGPARSRSSSSSLTF